MDKLNRIGDILIDTFSNVLQLLGCAFIVLLVPGVLFIIGSIVTPLNKPFRAFDNWYLSLGVWFVYGIPLLIGTIIFILIKLNRSTKV